MFPSVSWMIGSVTQEQDWERLARLVVAARVAHGMHTREQLAKAADFSTRFLGDIERARRTNYDPIYLARLEKALGWLPGSVDAILEGGEPTRIPAGDEDTATADEFADLELEVRMILEWDLPDSVRESLITEAWRLRERQASAKRRLEEQQASERRQWVSDWMKRARAADEPAT